MDLLKESKGDKVPLSNCHNIRIPTIVDVDNKEDYNIKLYLPYVVKKTIDDNKNKHYKSKSYRRYVDITNRIVIGAIIITFGVALTLYIFNNNNKTHSNVTIKQNKHKHAQLKASTNFTTVSFTNNYTKLNYKSNKYDELDAYPKGMSEDMKNILKDKRRVNVIDNYLTTLEKPSKSDQDALLTDHIYWGARVENTLPRGFGYQSTEIWERYINTSMIVKMDVGCGRMQNRLVTFEDGMQACVRYRQNTDQIQGEIFSFYLGKLLNLTNLAPSVVKVVDLNDKLWSGVADHIAASRWNTNRAVVLTQYIPSLQSAHIPDVFKPTERHLNKFDVLKLLLKENKTIDSTDEGDKTKTNANVEYFTRIDMKVNNVTMERLVELAQWSDLIIFDYLTANLDRIVNNLFNYQWNANIMDGPAHNLAKQVNSGLLVFLDNESGLLHGYRLLNKYNVYHSLLLDNLCVFRKSTINAVKDIYENDVLGAKLDEMYHSKNDPVIRDVLPPLPEKNKKVLYERFGKIINQVKKCNNKFSTR